MEENKVEENPSFCIHKIPLTQVCFQCEDGQRFKLKQPEIIPEETAIEQVKILSYDMSQTVDPEIKLEQATKAAKLLKHAMLQKKKPFILNDEIYPELEDWEMCGQFFGCTAVIISDKYTTEYGAVGFEAIASIRRIRDGNEVGRATAMCLMDEERWGGKPLYAIRSMAQTRACSKAFRLVFAWILVLAGYKPTPADEITQEMLDESKKPAQLKGIRVVD